jgi:hypothetical protein
MNLVLHGLESPNIDPLGISGSNANSFQVPDPPIRDQRAKSGELDDMQFEVDTLKKLQARLPPNWTRCSRLCSTKHSMATYELTGYLIETAISKIEIN